MNSKVFHSDHLSISISHCLLFSHLDLFFKANIHMGKCQIWRPFLHPAWSLLTNLRLLLSGQCTARNFLWSGVLQHQEQALETSENQDEIRKTQLHHTPFHSLPKGLYPVSSTGQSLLSRSSRHQSYRPLSLVLQKWKNFILSWSLLSNTKKPKPN